MKKITVKLSDGKNLNGYNTLELMDILEKKEKRKNFFYELISEADGVGAYKKNIISAINNDIKEIKKAINKINDYKKIIINNFGDYGVEILEIKFPVNTKKDYIKEWLYYNGLPINTEYYPSGSIYDCTGRVYETSVEIKNSVATLTSYRDV